MAITGRAATATEVTEPLLDSVRSLAPLIRDHADEAERSNRLSPSVVRALAEAGIFRMGVSRALGGLEVSPLTFYRVVEEAARLDGSTGWCVFIGGASALASAYLSDEAAQDIFGRDPLVVTAGSIAPMRKATVRAGGYVVTGRWPYASGCQHSSWIFGACHVTEGDQTRSPRPVAPKCDSFTSPLIGSKFMRKRGTLADWWGQVVMTSASMARLFRTDIRGRLALAT